MRVPLPPTPDILRFWQGRLLEALASIGVEAEVGVKRPASTEDLDGLFVRTVCLGGPWDFRSLWHPRLLAESWAPEVHQARMLDSVVGQATRLMEGARTVPSEESSGMFISSLDLDLAGADQTYEGSPFVLTTTQPLCIQVMPYERSAQP